MLCNRSRQERGAMLIIALGVLTLMALLGAAFASLIRLERRATENYVDSKRMDLLLDSALDRTLARLQGAKGFRHYTDYKDTPWLYLLKNHTGGLQGDVGNGRVDIRDSSVGKWEVFAERAGQKYSFKTKVIDCAAQINLNGEQDTLARMLDNLGLAIEQSSLIKMHKPRVRNPFYSRPNGQGDLIKGSRILQFRQRLPGGRFTSKTQLRLLIGHENFEVVKDFLTVHSWEDPFTYKADDGLNEIIDISGLTAVGGGRGLGGGGQGGRQPPAYGTPRLSPEPRCPININTAPEEVLIACLQGLAGRRVFPYSKISGGGGGMQQVDSNAQVQGQRPNAQEEVRDITPRAVFVYSPPLLYDHAKRIAERIIAQRREKPFTAWRTNDPRLPGFEDFIDGLDQNFFPSPNLSIVIDPDQPSNNQPETQIMRAAGAGEVSLNRTWLRGHGQGTVRQLRKELGLAFHDSYAWYYDLIKGVLKANFNPNSRINRYNPNAPAYIPVDKSDLVWARDRFNTFKGHTTEFCFDTNGIFEVTTLGRLSRRAGGGEVAVTSVEGAEAPQNVVLDPTDYLKQIVSVVKVYEVLRHTNQFHFEKTFRSASRSSANDRKNIVTWPEPMAALTELVSAGTLRDGRVELAGILDARRLEAPINNRIQMVRSFPALTMAVTYQDRDQASISRLRRVITQGGAQSFLKEEFSDALRDVLDTQYSRLQQPTNRRYYRRNELVQLGGQINPDALVLDPLVNKEVIGTDIMPDGFHSSLLTTAHLQSRVHALPARLRLGASGASGGNPIYGASGRGTRGNNTMGNVAYYQGGVAFWVKFDFDGDDPVFSGLLGCTQVIKEVPATASDYTGSEGTQFYLFKNSKGELRVVRMYYHQAFPQASAGGGGDSGGTGRLYPDPGAGSDPAGGGGQQNPILQELDEKKVISRSDLVANIAHFKAHEWHHIALDWDDQNSSLPIRLYIDFQEVKDSRPVFPQSIIDNTANSWVRLNERQPRDALYINGILRDQGEADAGVFKWFTNSTVTGGAVGAIQTVAPSVKRILGNATIDEFVAHDSTFFSVKQYYGGSGAPGYFSPQAGEYANLFEVPLPPEVNHVVLRSFDWTSYYPTIYTDSRLNSQPHRLNVTPMQCEFTFNAGAAALPPPISEPWRTPSIANQVAGRPIYRRETGLKGNNAEFVYKFRMTGGRSQSGNTVGGVVQTPAIDDVTLTYFLPSPRILFQEEEEIQ